MPRFAWIVEDGGINKTDRTMAPREIREWVRERFGEGPWERAVCWNPGDYMVVREGIYVLNWNVTKPEEAKDSIPLFLPYPTKILMTKKHHNFRVFRLAPKEHEQWRDKPVPELWHSLEIDVRVPLLERPVVQAGLGVAGVAIATGIAGRWLGWW